MPPMSGSAWIDLFRGMPWLSWGAAIHVVLFAAVLLHATRVARPVAAGLDGEDDALRAAGAHETLGVVRRREQAQRHLDDVGFHVLDAGERAPAAERILEEILEEGGYEAECAYTKSGLPAPFAADAENVILEHLRDYGG